jgi:hypothetical protein
MDTVMGPMPTTRRPSGLPTQTSQSHLFAVSSERSSGPLSNSRRSYFEHHLRIHSSTRFCMESLDAPLQSRVRRVATTYFLRPRDAQLFHFLRGSTFSSTTPRRTTRTDLSWPSARCSQPWVFSRRSLWDFSLSSIPRGYRCLLQLPVKTIEAKEHVCPRGFDEGLHGFAEVSSVYSGVCLGSS